MHTFTSACVGLSGVRRVVRGSLSCSHQPPQSASSALSHRSASNSGYSLLRLGLLCSYSHSCLSDFSASPVSLCTWKLSLPVQSTWEREKWGWVPQNTLCLPPPPPISSAWTGEVTSTGLLIYSLSDLAKPAFWAQLLPAPLFHLVGTAPCLRFSATCPCALLGRKFSSTSLSSLAGLIIKLTQIDKRKNISLSLYEGPKEYETQRRDQSRQVLDKETKNLWRTDKMKKLSFGY